MSNLLPAKDLPTPYRKFLTDKDDDILRFAVEGVDAGQTVCLVTLVEITGGAARAIGSQMAVWENGAYCGFVSGGCTEAAVAAEAMMAMEKGSDRFLRLGEGSPFFDISLPCGGGITLALHIVRNAKALRMVLAALERRCRAATIYNPARQRLSMTTENIKSGWTASGFVRQYRPRIRLHLCGRSIELNTTACLAQAAAFETVLHDHEQTLHPKLGALDADSAVALLYHDIAHEMPVLAQALGSDAFYIGALGSSRTHSDRCAALLARGFSQAQISRIHAPIGLIEKARDAHTLALSVLSEIAAARAAATR